MTGTDFAAAIDKKGLTVARVTGNDLNMIEAVRTADAEAGTIGALASGHRFADLMEGDFAVVTRAGDVFRLSPQKLDLEEIEQRLLDVQSSLPTVTRAYFAGQENAERIAKERAADDAARTEYLSDRAEIFADRQELRQATREAEKIVEATFETPVAAVSKAADIAGGIFGGAAKIVEAIGDFLGGLFGGPKDTKAQAEQKARAATNEETLHARDYAASLPDQEAEFDSGCTRKRPPTSSRI